MRDKTYNGWTNYETWAVKLWMDNDEGSQGCYSEMASEYRDNPNELSHAIEESHEQIKEEFCTVVGVFADLLNAAMSEVNWYEIAENLLSDLPELCTGCDDELDYGEAGLCVCCSPD